MYEMALCEGQLESSLLLVKEEAGSPSELHSPDSKSNMAPNLLTGCSPPLGLAVDYRSARSHFLPPEIELARRSMPDHHRATSESIARNALESSTSSVTPTKRKRGRPRVDKTSPEYVAQAAARKQAREMAAVMNSSSESSEKRKRGRPRVDKTSPEYIARKRSKELEAMERKAQRQYKRRATGDTAATSSGDVRVKRKYTRRAPTAGATGDSKRGRKKTDAQGGQTNAEKPRKRGRRRKSELAAAAVTAAAVHRASDGALIVNSEPIPVDSDDEPDLGGDSLSLDENLRALRHLHEKYANLGRDERTAGGFVPAAPRARNTPPPIVIEDDDIVKDARGPLYPSRLGPRDAQPGARARPPAGARVERLSSSSSSGSTGSDSSSSGSSGSSSSSCSSDGECERDGAAGERDGALELTTEEKLSRSVSPAPAWLPTSRERAFTLDSNSDRSDGEDAPNGREDSRDSRDEPRDRDGGHASLSESDNESPDKSFPCLLCGKWFSTNVTLKIHKRKHVRRSGGSGGSRWKRRSAGAYECDCCAMTFPCREHLFDHKADAHRGSMTVRCDVCRRCFEDEHELAAHDRTHTPDERAGRCGECGAQFERWEQLRRHRACAHPRTSLALGHACNQCGKTFGHAHSLTRHLANHSKAVFRCVVCKASFPHADLLAQHLNSHLANYKKLKP